jgi:hypothetical protein
MTQRGRDMAMIAALCGMAMLADDGLPQKPDEPTNAAPGRRDRTPEQSAARISARQERMARKLARRAARAHQANGGGDA